MTWKFLRWGTAGWVSLSWERALSSAALLSILDMTTSQRCLQISITHQFSIRDAMSLTARLGHLGNGCNGGGRETAGWALPYCLCAAEGREEESISGLDLHSQTKIYAVKIGIGLTLDESLHCSLVRCIHASSLQCLATFICGCAIINLSSPENYFFPSKVALPKVRSLFHCQSHL